MNEILWVLVGLAIIPAGVGVIAAWNYVAGRLRWWYTKPYTLNGRTLHARRSLIVGMTLELLDASHVRAIRLPFNRVFIIRSNPQREYNIVGQDYVVIGADFQVAETVLGKALDELGYTVEPDE